MNGTSPAGVPPAREVVVIESLAAGGAGVARLADGMIVFVPRTAPGDRVLLGPVRRHRRHAEARAEAIVAPGAGRVSPACPHFTLHACGGCQWQHLSAGVQAEAKRRIVGDALRRIGRLDVPDPELAPSPRHLGYRTTVTLTVRRAGGRVTAGFHDDRDPDVVFPLERCHIARPELQALWESLAPQLGVLPAGEDVRLRLRLASDGSLHVLVSGGDGAWTGGRALERAAAAAGLAVSVWWQPGRGALRRLAGPDADPALVAFGQVNAEVAAGLRAAVVAAAGGGGPDRAILDLYAGAGETALPLAAAGHRVTLVEVDAASVRRAEALARSAGVGVRAIAGRVEDHVAALLPADVVVVNPPRAGLSDAVASALLPGAGRAAPARLVYVSCDPATLARDLRRLGVSAGDLRLVRSWDMFPQTSHVETLVVADLGRRDAALAAGG